MDKLIKYKKRASNWAISALCLFVAFWVILIIIPSSDILAISVLLTVIGIIISIAFSLSYIIRYSVSFARFKHSSKTETQQADDTLIGYLKGGNTHIPIEPVLPTGPAHATVASIPQDDHSPNSFSGHRQYGGVDTELLNIDLMEGHDFEYWCAALLRNIGFSNVEVTQGSGDQGVDVLAEKDGIRYAIQCKCYSKDLGNSPVQEVSAGKMMPQYRCQVGAVMTNRYFTKGAQDLAAATGTLLWDRDWISRQLQLSGPVSASHLHTQSHNPNRNNELLENIMDDFFRYDDVSISYIQRRFGLDYDYASFILNTLEEHGFIVQPKGDRAGYVKISCEMWQKVKNRPGTPTPKR